MATKLLVISIDTESDWFDSRRNTIASIGQLSFVQEACLKYGMLPTYLVTYEIATSDHAVRILKDYSDHGLCEIGHHLHVWSTPPFEDRNAYGVDEKWIDGIQSELPDDTFEEKMRSLHDAIKTRFGITPTSHRAGRWSIDGRTLAWLEKNKYLVDSSVCPYNSYTKTRGVNEYIKTDTYAAPNHPYRPDRHDITHEARAGNSVVNILEIPVTGIRGDCFSRVRMKGIGRMRSVLNKFWYTGSDDMSFRPSYWLVPLKVFQKITHDLFQSDMPLINFMFHSNELLLGGSPYSASDDRLQSVKDKILFVLKTAKEYGMQGVTLSGAAGYFNKQMPA